VLSKADIFSQQLTQLQDEETVSQQEMIMPPNELKAEKLRIFKQNT
jgi:hypothetical protein